MAQPDLKAARIALARIADPARNTDILASGRVKGLTAKDGRIGCVLEIAPDEAEAFEAVQSACETALGALEGVERVVVILTAHSEAPGDRSAPPRPAASASPAASAPTSAPPRSGPSSGPGSSGHGRIELPDVTDVVAVASGKGGVGKSTIAANLACALARQGKKVGLLDADVFGPSAPILFGLEGARPDLDADKRIVPPQAYGVKVMSMGFMAGAGTAMIWRGPMVMNAISQMLEAVNWGVLDVLVVDLPPGTGDAQLTLAQRAPLSGAVIVSTPQKLALADVRRGVEMFAKVEVPLLGVIENMSATTDPATGVRIAPFGEGGARKAADEFGAPFLGAIPLNTELAEASDAGKPPAAEPEPGPIGRQFLELASAISAALAAGTLRPPPEIIFD